jgi:hypothetical protein
MNVTHSVREARDLNIDDLRQLINTMFEIAGHPGIAQFRVGSVTVTILDTAVDIIFSTPLPDNDYEVFLQLQSNVSVIVFPSNKVASGFRLNLSVGVAATFSYFAVGSV